MVNSASSFLFIALLLPFLGAVVATSDYSGSYQLLSLADNEGNIMSLPPCTNELPIHCELDYKLTITRNADDADNKDDEDDGGDDDKTTAYGLNLQLWNTLGGFMEVTADNDMKMGDDVEVSQMTTTLMARPTNELRSLEMVMHTLLPEAKHIGRVGKVLLFAGPQGTVLFESL